MTTPPFRYVESTGMVALPIGEGRELVAFGKDRKKVESHLLRKAKSMPKSRPLAQSEE